jgi:uncharacterized protein YjiS (DUF1127 family)
VEGFVLPTEIEMSMTTATAFAGTPGHAPLWTRVARGTVRMIRLWKNRRAIYQLGELSDTQLADIGLRRGDLLVAYNMPLDVDPTERLGVMASARARNAL